jgi:hypothetical protein
MVFFCSSSIVSSSIRWFGSAGTLLPKRRVAVSDASPNAGAFDVELGAWTQRSRSATVRVSDAVKN